MMTMILYILFGVVWAVVIAGGGGVAALAIPLWSMRWVRLYTIGVVSMVVFWGVIATLVILKLLERQA